MIFILIICNQFVWGQQKGFQVNPQAIDNMDGDSVFSPNGDGVQDALRRAIEQVKKGKPALVDTVCMRGKGKAALT